ncbi:MAG: hypothetical protein K0B08_12135 [Bacteroidales bacterium]|nr:hypothetical protein [Bacteroidales bacterium]
MKLKLGLILFSFFLVIILSVILNFERIDTIKTWPDEDWIGQSTVCPPFFLYDEDGNIINPVSGENSDKPY